MHSPADDPSALARLRSMLRELYEGTSQRSVRFRYALLAFDIVTVAFIIATSFLPTTDVTDTIDILFGLLILADFAARLLISRRPMRQFSRLSTWTDIIAIVSFLAPLAGEALGFLR